MSYTEQLLALGQILERGKVHHVAVLHDDWCEIYSGGPCTCNPDVRVLDGPPPAKWSQDFRRRCREKRKAARSGGAA